MGLRLIHISDSHLFGDPAAELKGIRPYESLAAVLADAHARHPDIDALILGGDMAQDESEQAYRMLVDMLPAWRAPVMLTPGNHAFLPHVERTLIPALQARFSYLKVLRGGCWQVITLNTHQPGKVPGLLGADALQQLHQLLAASPERHALIALHHHPLPVGSQWLDAIGLHNADELWEVLGRHAQVRALLCGHIHQAFDGEHAGVRVLGSPSTWVQFMPGSDAFRLEAVSPGYRWLHLLDDGSLQTGIHRIEGFVPPSLCDTVAY